MIHSINRVETNKLRQNHKKQQIKEKRRRRRRRRSNRLERIGGRGLE